MSNGVQNNMQVQRRAHESWAVDFERNEDDFKVAMYAAMGLSNRFIRSQIRADYSNGQIGYRLKLRGIRRMDYRNGESPAAKFIIQKTEAAIKKRLDDYYYPLHPAGPQAGEQKLLAK